MDDLKQAIHHYANRDLSQRKAWYSAAADAYDRARPPYPNALIQQVIEIAALSADSTLLEIGCGPGTATIDFAPLGCSIVGLEPNPDFYAIAQRNCAAYPHVTLHNSSFEEWTPEPEGFDAVLAASSFHWLPAEIAYPKAAQALKAHGKLILLWNKELHPTPAVHQRLSPIYQTHAPWLDRYEAPLTQIKIIHQIGQMIPESGYFEPPSHGHLSVEVTYSVDRYLLLLQTYSPYLRLDPAIRAALLADLRQTLLHECGETLQLTYLSAFHIAGKTVSNTA